nr:hydrogenase formation protein HypD [Steroidobacteraceae bacterium]
MQAILMLVRQVNDGRCEVENEFSRAVNRDGNLKAQAMVAEVFELRRAFEWRGLGEVPYSALAIKEAFATACTPENPLGSCMVSSEGACAAHYTYGRFRTAARPAAAGAAS